MKLFIVDTLAVIGGIAGGSGDLLTQAVNSYGTCKSSNGSGDISASVDTRTQPGIIGTFALSDAAGFEYVAGFRVQ